MIRNIRLAAAGLALAGAFALNPLSAAMKPGTYLNGQWGSVDGGGRGATLTYIPDPAGGGDLFALLFSYNEATGDNTWLILQAAFLENQFQSTGEVFITEGGSFSNPPVSPSQTAIGTFEVTLNSCGENGNAGVVYDIDFDNGSGFPDATYALENLTARNTPANETPNCIYKEEFTGCPAFATGEFAAGRSCFVSGQILDDEITLTNEITWVLDGLLEIGAPGTNPSTLNIEPGTTIVSDPATINNAYIFVHAGSKIFADGKPYAPIVMTSAFDGFDAADPAPEPGDFGGLVVAGFSTCNTAPDQQLGCFSEFATADQVLPYGGTDPTDDSGSMSYMQIRYGGIPVGVDQEVNTFTFLAVGNKTRAHHLQAYNGLDDGFEMFGGTVNLYNIVATDGADDYLDWDEGYDGLIQFALISINDQLGGQSGIEASNSGTNFDNLPRATPIISNFTIVRNVDESERGFRIKDGTGGQFWNSVVTGFNTCVSIEDMATINAAPDNTAIAGNIFDCATNFGGDDPAFTSNFVAGFPGNVEADPNLDPDTFRPLPGSPALGNGIQVIDLDSGEPNPFFKAVPYSGAFGGQGDNWLEGWTFDPFGVER